MSSPEKLIEELYYNANASGHQPLEQRMADITLWFHKNYKEIPRDNLASRQAFLEKAFWIQLEINALLLERLRKQTGSSHLWIPRGMRLENGKEFA